MEQGLFSTSEVAERAGVHRDTLLRWLRESKVPEPSRDRHGWRVFTDGQLEHIVAYSQNTSSPPVGGVDEYRAAIERLSHLDWAFAEAKTRYLTHSLHPYAAKFIPQIPNALIQELSSIGETVLDPFCGSGTTLVEAMRLGRQAVGVDANPLACLISRAKTAQLDETDCRDLLDLSERVADRAASDTATLRLPFASEADAGTDEVPAGVIEWFYPHVIEELSLIRRMATEVASPRARDIALTAFSSIIVGVSQQDSETRYVRVSKSVPPGETLKRFARALQDAVTRSVELSSELPPESGSTVHWANILDQPPVGSVDLVVCSPPYPNAYSYHLYHRTRLVWLGMDDQEFKRNEIGSHRKYSSRGRNRATVETFEAELTLIMDWLRGCLRQGRHACFVIGDSTLAGEKIRNDLLLVEVAGRTGFTHQETITRRLQDHRKSFNPTVGKIKEEKIVILRKQ